MSNIPTGDFHGNLLRYADWLAAWWASRIGFFAGLVQGHRRVGGKGGGAFRCSVFGAGLGLTGNTGRRIVGHRFRGVGTMRYMGASDRGWDVLGRRLFPSIMRRTSGQQVIWGVERCRVGGG